LAAISSAVGGGGRSLSDKSSVEVMMEEIEDGSSFEMMKRPIPSFIGELYDMGLIADAASTTTGAGSIVIESLIVFEPHAAAVGLTKKHDADAARERRATKSNWYESFIFFGSDA
jgi:hypothetical protein